MNRAWAPPGGGFQLQVGVPWLMALAGQFYRLAAVFSGQLSVFRMVEAAARRWTVCNCQMGPAASGWWPVVGIQLQLGLAALRQLPIVGCRAPRQQVSAASLQFPDEAGSRLVPGGAKQCWRAWGSVQAKPPGLPGAWVVPVAFQVERVAYSAIYTCPLC